MRMVSWIVVVGAMAWLLYGQLRIHFPEEALASIPDETVSGTVDGAMASRGPETDLNEALDGPVAFVAYSDVYPMIEATTAAAAFERVDATTVVRTREPAIQPAGIQLYLDDGEQLHEFSVGPNGEVSLPARSDWRDAGLLLQSNQPQDSLDLQVSFLMQPLPGPRVEYAWLWETKEQVGAAMNALQAAEMVPPGDVVGVVFVFGPGQRGTLETGSGGAVMMADEQGFLRFEMSADRLAANPMLAVSPMPERMVPLLAPPDGK